LHNQIWIGIDHILLNFTQLSIQL